MRERKEEKQQNDQPLRRRKEDEERNGQRGRDKKVERERVRRQNGNHCRSHRPPGVREEPKGGSEERGLFKFLLFLTHFLLFPRGAVSLRQGEVGG